MDKPTNGIVHRGVMSEFNRTFKVNNQADLSGFKIILNKPSSEE